jgi:membrane-bound acyltransferase YfiQ involved in biofilm formation
VTAAVPDPTGSRQSFTYQLPQMKGLCILAVVSIHVTTGFEASTRLDGLTALLVFLNALARFAVPVFVVLSGFYLSLSPRNEHARSFYRRTLKPLVVPYVIYTAIYTILYIPTPGSLATLGRALVRHVLLGTGYYHLWFGLLIIELYAIHPWRRWYRRRRQAGLVVLSAFAVQIAWASFREFDVLPLNPPLWLGLLYRAVWWVSHVGYLLAGYYLHDHAGTLVDELRRRRSGAVGLAIGLASGLGIAAYWAVPIARGTPFAGIGQPNLAICLLAPALSLGVLPLIVRWTRAADPTSSPLRGLVHSFGLYSYGVYYLHELFLSAVWWALLRFTPFSFGDAILYVVAFPAGALLTLSAARFLARFAVGRYLT